MVTLTPVNPLPGSEVLSPDTGYMCYHPGKWYFDFWKYSFFGPIGGYAIDLALYLDYGDNPMDRMDPEASYPLWHGWSIRSEIRIREARWRDDPYTSIVDHFEYYDDIMGGYISTEVPLPSTVLLLGSGLLGLAGWRRFRKG